jgi:hypothetical protein
MSTYSEKLKDPRWQKKRLEIMQRDEFSCKFCTDTDTTLHVHHLAYHQEPWDTPNEQLITLCEDCHQRETDMRSLAERKLLQSLKDAWFSCDDIDNITDGFNKIIMFYPPEVMSNILKFALNDYEIIKSMSNKYLESKKDAKTQND